MQTAPNWSAAFPPFLNHRSELPGQMHAILRQAGPRTSAWLLREQWGRGFGSVHYGDARRSIGSSGSLRFGYGDYGSPWNTFSHWNVGDQRVRIFSDRRPDDATDRAAAATSQLAPSPGGRISGWLYHFLQLRMGIADAGQGRRAMAWVAEYRRKCGVRIYCGLARCDHDAEAAIRMKRKDVTNAS